MSIQKGSLEPLKCKTNKVTNTFSHRCKHSANPHFKAQASTSHCKKIRNKLHMVKSCTPIVNRYFVLFSETPVPLEIVPFTFSLSILGIEGIFSGRRLDKK